MEVAQMCCKVMQAKRTFIPAQAGCGKAQLRNPAHKHKRALLIQSGEGKQQRRNLRQGFFALALEQRGIRDVHGLQLEMTSLGLRRIEQKEGMVAAFTTCLRPLQQRQRIVMHITHTITPGAPCFIALRMQSLQTLLGMAGIGTSCRTGPWNSFCAA